MVDGRVLVFDAADGRALANLRSQGGISTRLVTDRDAAWFGCADGHVRAVDLAEGRVSWSFPTGRPVADGDLVADKAVVLVTGAEGKLLAIDRVSGRQVGAVQITGDLLPGMRLQGKRLLVQVRRARTREQPARDVLVAIDVPTMTIAWEHVDSGARPGLVGIDELTIALPSAGGEVVLFR
jgi:outer membrane protein assembly factor BamB